MKIRAIFFGMAGLIFSVVFTHLPAAMGADLPNASTNLVVDYFVQTWQEEEGLPRNTITAINQTSDGYLWLGTFFGLIRYDGINFKTFGAEIRPELVRSLIGQLQTDRAGRLWLGTGKGGILVYEQGAFHLINASSGLPHPTVYSMCEDRDGVMWVATGDGSITRIVGGATTETIGFLRGKPSSMVIQILRDKQGDLWFAQGSSCGRLNNGVATNVFQFNSGLVHLCPSQDGGIWMAVNRQLRKLNGLAKIAGAPLMQLPFGNYEIQKLFEDGRGNLWIGTRNQGLFRVKGGEVQLVLPSKNRILDIFEDAEGSLWVATEGGGLSKLRPRVFHLLSSPEGGASSKVLSVCEDQSGSIWMAPQVGGLLRYDSVSGEIKMLAGTTNMGLRTVLPDGGAGLWAGTVSRGLLHYDGEKLEQTRQQLAFRDRQIRVLYTDRKGGLWIALFPFGLAHYADDQLMGTSYYHGLGLSDQAIWAIAEEKDGALWFGTITGDLHRLSQGKITSYTTADGLSGMAISALHVDDKGTLWIGTQGSGLGCFREGKFKFVSVVEGLHDNVISQIVEDDNGFLWLGSNRGIFRVCQQSLEAYMTGQLSKVESIAYGKSDGLANIECTGGFQPSVWKTATGQLLFATSKGSVLFDPAALPLNSQMPPLLLEAMTVDGESISPRAPVELKWDHRNLQFIYTAPSFVAPEKVRFRHQLVGFDNDWVEDGNRSATYSRLAPGSYEFRFTACNNDGIWNNQPVSLVVVVNPAWWQQTWFRVSVVVIFATVVGLLVRYFSVLTIRRRLLRVEHAHAMEKERTRIARDIHDDVGARLTQMAYLSDLASTEIAEGLPRGSERLKEIVRASRQTVHALDEIVWAVNPGKDSLAHLLEYISQYANNFFSGTNCHCRQDLPVNIPDWTLSSEFRHHLFLVVKEALNNVQKHSKATEVWIRVALRPAELELIIEDNGAGFAVQAVNPSRDGLKNMNERLAALGGTCRISSQAGQGTQLILTVVLPKINTKSNAT